MKLLRSCQEVAKLISAREDRPLKLGERLVLRVHASMCRNCGSWEKQVSIMRKGMREWGHYRENDNN